VAPVGTDPKKTIKLDFQLSLQVNNMDNTEALTELDAATAYARAWNALDATQFLELLAPDAHYASQWVCEELESKAAITAYLTGKMETVKSSKTPVFAELGKTSTGFAGRDCVVLAQGQKDAISAAVLFDVERGRIKWFDLCMPELLGLIRSGQYLS
jgi:hypothetical protein